MKYSLVLLLRLENFEFWPECLKSKLLARKTKYTWFFNFEDSNLHSSLLTEFVILLNEYNLLKKLDNSHSIRAKRHLDLHLIHTKKCFIDFNFYCAPICIVNVNHLSSGWKSRYRQWHCCETFLWRLWIKFKLLLQSKIYVESAVRWKQYLRLKQNWNRTTEKDWNKRSSPWQSVFFRS